MTVFAAASLTEAFTGLGERFEAEYPGVEVEFSFGGSSSLASQIVAGAPADVFASADRRNMERVSSEGLTGEPPTPFAGNILEIALPRGNPGDVMELEDLGRARLRVAVCDAQVPCGHAASRVFAKAGLEPSIDSYELDVKAVLTKVELGEVDAGLVYRSDVLAAGEMVESITIPPGDQVGNVYPIAPIRDSASRDFARKFIDLVLGDDGQAELEKWGFRPAPP